MCYVGVGILRNIYKHLIIQGIQVVYSSVLCRCCQNNLQVVSFKC